MKTLILGAGITGVAASWASGATAYESEAQPGGICRSYEVDGYRFEVGGGHWVFGGDPLLNRFLNRWAVWHRYQRRSAVFFPQTGRYAPYPLQYHLHALDRTIARQALAEMQNPNPAPAVTMADWIEATFGPTLTNLFFGPFHELYTAGLWREAAPQDEYKTPLRLAAVEKGLSRGEEDGGYNQTFLYPQGGLHSFVDALAAKGSIACNRQIVRIDAQARRVHFTAGASEDFESALCTLPLDLSLRLADIQLDEPTWPGTSVLVLNIGGVRGAGCPQEHWIYVPHSRSGFHRVGCYSNVDPSFVPANTKDRVSFYVEKAFRRGDRPTESQTQSYSASVVQELQDWGYLGQADVVSPTWVETAYTWALPGSRWREVAINKLAEAGIFMTGRYGKWQFQGIADSLRDGLTAGAALALRQ